MGGVRFLRDGAGSHRRDDRRGHDGRNFRGGRSAAIGLGRELERRDGGVTTAWWKEERGERIFVDYNQNARDHTIAAAYSVRGVASARVSAPVRWEEVDQCQPEDFTIFTMPARFAEVGDLHATIDDHVFDLAPLREWADRDEAEGAETPPEPESE